MKKIVDYLKDVLKKRSMKTAQRTTEVYRLSLEHNMGYAYAQYIDFTDVSEFSGRLAYVFKLMGDDKKLLPTIEELISSGVEMGPFVIYNKPPKRGKWSWGLLYQTERSFVSEWPKFKSQQGIITRDRNWANMDGWRILHGVNGPSESVESYGEVRSLETTILQTSKSIMQKMTMHLLLSKGEIIQDYYDLTDQALHNIYVQMINTYRSYEEVVELLQDVHNIYE